MKQIEARLFVSTDGNLEVVSTASGRVLGRLASLRPRQYFVVAVIEVPELPGAEPNLAGPVFMDLAASADGQPVAFATTRCSGSQGHVGVIDIRTRSVKMWTFGEGNVAPYGLSLSANGGLLALFAATHRADLTPRLETIILVGTSSGAPAARPYTFTRPGAQATGLTLDTSGRYLLIYGWRPQGRPAEYPAVEIDLATGHTRTIHGAMTGYVASAAW